MSSEGSDKSANPSNGANALLGDLESIRTLLSEEDEAARGREHQTAADETGTDAPVPTRAEASAPGTATSGGAEDEAIASGDDEVPLLEDVVSGSLGIDDLAAEHPSGMDAQGSRSGLNDDLFRVLLGEDWREAAAGILDQARTAIESHKLQWLPEDTDALNEALRVRIDETVHRWLREAVLDGMDDLRAQLLQAITDQLEISVQRHLQFHQADEDAHGK